MVNTSEKDGSRTGQREKVSCNVLSQLRLQPASWEWWPIVLVCPVLRGFPQHEIEGFPRCRTLANLRKLIIQPWGSLRLNGPLELSHVGTRRPTLWNPTSVNHWMQVLSGRGVCDLVTKEHYSALEGKSWRGLICEHGLLEASPASSVWGIRSFSPEEGSR